MGGKGADEDLGLNVRKKDHSMLRGKQDRQERHQNYSNEMIGDSIFPISLK